MVFGWGKKKPQKKEPEQFASQEKEVTLNDIPKILEEIKALRSKTMISEAKSFRNNIESQREEILKIANDLESDDLKVDDLDKHLQILVVRGKKLVISTIQKDATEKFPEISSYDDVSQMNTKLSQMLKRIGDVLGRQSRVIHIFAKKYASKLKGHLAIMTSNQQEIKQLVGNYKELTSNISEILEKINAHENSQKMLEQNNQRISSLKNSLDNFDQIIESKKQKIEDLKSTNEYSKYLELQKNIESLSSEESQIKNEIDLQFTKISRPVSKYGYISSLEKPQKKLMERLVDNPFGAISSSNKDDIVEILYAVRKGVGAGSVSVKDSEKSVSQIDETIGMLDNFISKIGDFMKRKNDLESQLTIFDIEKLNQEKRELEKNLIEKKDTESKIKNLENNVSETNSSLPNQIMDIEEKLRDISRTKYHVSE